MASLEHVRYITLGGIRATYHVNVWNIPELVTTDFQERVITVHLSIKRKCQDVIEI